MGEPNVLSDDSPLEGGGLGFDPHQEVNHENMSPSSVQILIVMKVFHVVDNTEFSELNSLTLGTSYLF